MTIPKMHPIVALCCCSVFAGCTSDERCGSGSRSTGVTTGFAEPVPVEGSACGAVVTEEEEALATHVAECSNIEYGSNPPSSGPHYPSWAAFGTYDTTVPRGFWMHSLEHGAVVILYNCDDCEDEVRRAESWIEQLPEDPICAGMGVARRVILTPDPRLDVRWAAAAWTFTLRSDCFEAEVFQSFTTQHYGRGLENTCARGREI